MKTVNLLPSWYLQQHRQKRHLQMHLAAMLVLAGALFGAWTLGQKDIARQNATRDGLAAKLAAIADPQALLREAQGRLQYLENRKKACSELGKTLPMSCVLQQLQNDMTTGMALSRVYVEVRPDPVKGSGLVGDQHNPPKYHDVAYLSVEGIAPNDAQITKFWERLSSNPLFADVNLDYTRSGTLAAYLVRKFELKMKMDLERLTTENPDAEMEKKLATGGSANGG
jgi:Tfp pilus assembly protein PilN